MYIHTPRRGEAGYVEDHEDILFPHPDTKGDEQIHIYHPFYGNALNAKAYKVGCKSPRYLPSDILDFKPLNPKVKINA